MAKRPNTTVSSQLQEGTGQPEDTPRVGSAPCPLDLGPAGICS